MKHGRLCLKACTILSPTRWWDWFTLTFDGQQALNPLIKVLPTLGPMNCITKGIQYVDDILDIENHTFISWNKAQTKFNLIVLDTDDWTLLTSKIINLWKHRLEDDSFVTHLEQWVGFYIEVTNDLVYVLYCLTKFTPHVNTNFTSLCLFLDKW